MNTAAIYIFLKPSKYTSILSNFSFIYVDMKIVIKALSQRLEKAFPSIIHPDQTIFFLYIKKKLNKCRFRFHALFICSTSKCHYCHLWSHKKSFWLRKLNFDEIWLLESFTSWNKILYVSTLATIITSQSFPLHKEKKNCKKKKSYEKITKNPSGRPILRWYVLLHRLKLG